MFVWRIRPIINQGQNIPNYGICEYTTNSRYFFCFVHVGILDLVLKKLDDYRDLTFQWTETVFLERWFRDIDERKKQQVTYKLMKEIK